MNRSPALKSLRTLVALLVTLLQLIGALHFSLVRHSYSAALGGVVHVHGAASARPAAKPAPPSKSRGAQVPSATSDTPSCSADLCPAANASQSVAPEFEALDSGTVADGSARLLSEGPAHALASRRVLLGAPKTSPPV